MASSRKFALSSEGDISFFIFILLNLPQRYTFFREFLAITVKDSQVLESTFSTMEQQQLLKTLKRVWGYDTFRPLQGEIISTVMGGGDCVGLLPTGGGKSITFQLPALCSEGLVIVITPLVALMRDQVERLRKRHINAVMINSSMSARQIDITLDNCIYGDVKLLYIAPERIDTLIFRTRLKRMNVSMVAIDEAHCISQWGHDFRPSYLRIGSLREALPSVPFLALTATATEVVLRDIIHFLKLKDYKLYRDTFARPNIRFVVRETTNKYEQLLRIVESIDGTGIVYCRTRKSTEATADFLRSQGISADFYHAGMASQLRTSKQREWSDGKIRVIVATNAFGMGIDKSDVRFVVHYQMPESIEAYYQEAGRAGRDGEMAWAVLLFESADSQKLSQKIELDYPPLEDIKAIYEKLFNYYSIAIGDGKDTVKDFSLMEFAAYAKYYSLTIHAALKILELGGYIALTDELDNPTRIKFRIERDDLYRLRVDTPKIDNFLRAMLRSYTGLFSDFTAIDEAYLAKVTGMAEHDVVKLLLELSRQKVISYIPRRRTPLIAFTEERLPISDLYIAPETYSSRRALSELRSLSMVEYVEQKEICRPRILREYFDEETQERCGTCDVCISNREGQQQREEQSLEEIKERIIELLSGKRSYTLHTLIGSLRCHSELALRAIRSHLANNRIRQMPDGTIQLR